MNAINPAGSSTGWSSAGTSGILSQSGLSRNGGSTGSYYASNLVVGNNNNPSTIGQSVMFSNGTSFASEAYKSRNTMENAWSGVKSQSVTSPVSPGAQAAIGLATGVASAGVAAAGFGPVALAMQVSQAIGTGIQSQLTASATQQTGANYQSNLRQWAIGGNKSADSYYMAQQQQTANATSGATIGAMFGPVGALIGWWAGMMSSSAPSQAGNYTVGGFGGQVSASDSGIAPSVNTDAATGNSTMIESL